MDENSDKVFIRLGELLLDVIAVTIEEAGENPLLYDAIAMRLKKSGIKLCENRGDCKE